MVKILPETFYTFHLDPQTDSCYVLLIKSVTQKLLLVLPSETSFSSRSAFHQTLGRKGKSAAKVLTQEKHHPRGNTMADDFCRQRINTLYP